MVSRICVFVLLLSPTLLFAQDPGFSQFFANPLYLNPAFSGTTEQPRTIVNFRNQWPQKGTTYTTYSLSYDQVSKNMNTGFGIQLLHDRELSGIINTNTATLFYSYHIKFNPDNFMTLGLQAGAVVRQFNSNGLIFPSQINQLTGEVSGEFPAIAGDERKVYPDFAFGLMGQSKPFFYGVALHHLTQPDEALLPGDQTGKRPVKITLHAGARARKRHYGLLSREFTLSPNLLYQQQGSFKQLNVGMYLIEKSLLVGAWFRNNLAVRPDAVILLAGMAHKRFQFGYSFDLTLSKLANYSYGSHEISLTFFVGQKKHALARDQLLIPML